MIKSFVYGESLVLGLYRDVGSRRLSWAAAGWIPRSADTGGGGGWRSLWHWWAVRNAETDDSEKTGGIGGSTHHWHKRTGSWRKKGKAASSSSKLVTDTHKNEGCNWHGWVECKQSEGVGLLASVRTCSILPLVLHIILDPNKLERTDLSSPSLQWDASLMQFGMLPENADFYCGIICASQFPVSRGQSHQTTLASDQKKHERTLTMLLSGVICP